MIIEPIRDEAGHARAMARIAELWHAAAESDGAYELDALATLVSAYEARRYPIPPAEPIDVLRYAVSDMGHTQAELASLLGSRSRASEVLNGKRPLTVDMIRSISAAWHIPVELLVGQTTDKRPLAKTG